MDNKPLLMECIAAVGDFRKALCERLATAYPLLEIRAKNALETLENGFRVAAGEPIQFTNAGLPDQFKIEPLTHVLDTAILDARKNAQSVSEAEPEDADISQLKAEVEKAFQVFLTMDDKAIMANIEPLTIMGVAKKAGLAEFDKDITPEFIKEIKAGIEKQIEASQSVQSGVSVEEKLAIEKQEIIEKVIELFNEHAEANKLPVTPDMYPLLFDFMGSQSLDELKFQSETPDVLVAKLVNVCGLEIPQPDANVTESGNNVTESATKVTPEAEKSTPAASAEPAPATEKAANNKKAGGTGTK